MNLFLATLFAAVTAPIPGLTTSDAGGQTEVVLTTVIHFGEAPTERSPARAMANANLATVALEAAFDQAESYCGGSIRQLGFDTHEVEDSYSADVWFLCADAELQPAE